MSEQTDKIKKSLDSIANSKTTKKVTYKDSDGEKHTVNVVLKEPSVVVTNQAYDYLQSDGAMIDFDGIYKLVMDKVIIHPKLSYKDTDKYISQHPKLRKRDLNATNEDGDKFKLHLKFPGAKKAVQIIALTYRSTGAANRVAAFDALNKFVFKNDSGQPVSEDYWDAGGQAHGLGSDAYDVGMAFLNKDLAANGFSQIINAAIPFLKGNNKRGKIEVL